MDVREDAGLSPDYRLKLNSYDLAVDIELADAVQRIRFEHPEIHAVVIASLKERIFCAGANIMMLRESSHAVEGELLQVHQRDPAGDGGREPAFRDHVPGGGQRHLRRRRLRARARVRRDPAGRRRQFGGQPAGSAAAGRAPRHRRADAPRRQAPRSARSRRRVLHAGRRRQRQAGGRMGARRRGPSHQPVQRRRQQPRPRARRTLRSSVERSGHRPGRARADRHRRRHHAIRRCR